MSDMVGYEYFGDEKRHGVVIIEFWRRLEYRI